MKKTLFSVLIWIILFSGGAVGANQFIKHEKQDIIREVLLTVNQSQPSENKQLFEISEKIKSFESIMLLVEQKTTFQEEIFSSLSTQMGELYVQIEKLKSEVNSLK